MLEHARVVKTIKMNQVTAWDDTTAITGGVRQNCVWGRPLTQQMLDLAEVCYLRGKKRSLIYNDDPENNGKILKHWIKLNLTVIAGAAEGPMSCSWVIRVIYNSFSFFCEHVVKEAATDLHWSWWFWQHLNTTGRVFFGVPQGHVDPRHPRRCDGADVMHIGHIVLQSPCQCQRLWFKLRKCLPLIRKNHNRMTK